MNRMTVDGSDAPWNDEKVPPREIDVTICLAISKTVKVLVDDYEFEDDGISPDFSNCDVFSAIQDQITLPTDLSYMVNTLFKEDLDLKAAKMPRYLQYALEDCKDWNIDDFEVIQE